MGLEVPAYVGDLNAANPASGDKRKFGDDHFRYLKTALKQTMALAAPTFTTTGVAPAFVLTTGHANTPTLKQQLYIFILHAALVGDDTLEVDSLGAKNLQKMTAAGWANVAAGDALTGHVLLSYYDTVAGKFRIISTYNIGVPDGSITAAKLASDAVETAKIKDLNVTTGKLAANAVSNAKLAQMAAATIKGNNTGGASDPLDLTAAQATAMLAAVVGDSGSGGTKGLVPAPGAGDAAANKFLKASGAWATLPVSEQLKLGGIIDTGVGAPSQQVSGLNALGARHLLVFGHMTLSSGNLMTLRLLDSGGTSLISEVSGTADATGVRFVAVFPQILGSAAKKFWWAYWVSGGASGGGWATNGTGTAVGDQVQVVPNTGNILGNMQVYYVT